MDLLIEKIIKEIKIGLSGSYEEEEIQRTIDYLGINISSGEIVKMFNEAKPITASQDILSSLDNTDYNEVNNPEDVKEKLIEYGRNPKNYDKILQEIASGIWYPPLILHILNTYYLVGGNTRLMVAKVNNIKPIVKIVSLNGNNN